jgi:hypothetical protein
MTTVDAAKAVYGDTYAMGMAVLVVIDSNGPVPY